MFTGIIERLGVVTQTRSTPGGRILSVDLGPIADDCTAGASVCISGVCLTVVSVSGPCVSFDVINETLNKTVLGSKKPGHRVNVERSLRADSRLDGHFVQGHVDGTGTVTRVRSSAREYIIWIDSSEEIEPYIISKGSVAIDGVSLTVADLAGRSFSVALIPTTLELTTLSSLVRGDSVNIETDIIARTVVHTLRKVAPSSGLTPETLRKAGLA